MPPLKEALLKIPTLLEVGLSICNWRKMLLRNILRWKKILWCLEHQKSIISHEGPLKELHKALLCCFILQRQPVSDPWHEGASWNKTKTKPGNVLYSYLESKSSDVTFCLALFFDTCVFSKWYKDHQRPEKCLFHFKVMVLLWYLEGSVSSLSNLHARLII